MSTFQALRHRDFRLYFVGQTASMIGTWMQSVALAWMVYVQTGQPKWLGIVVFAAQAPAFLFSPFSGAAADRYSSRPLVFLVQLMLLFQALGMSYLAWRPHASITWILALSVLLGILTAFDVTGRQVLVAQTVPREDLPNAIALNSASFHGSRIVGPALAGWAIDWFGYKWCFLINALSYLAALLAVAWMHAGNEERSKSKTPGSNALLGFRFVSENPKVRLLFILMGLIVLLGMPYTALIPVISNSMLQSGATGMGWLMGAGGVGATFGALFLARQSGRMPLERLILLAAFAFSLMLGLFSWMHHFWLSTGLLALQSFFLVLHNTGNQTLVQLALPDHARGRVMALYSMVFIGSMPLGALWGGYAAQVLGIRFPLFAGALGCALAAGYYAWISTKAPPSSR